jgi:hypothetical protein
VGKKFVSPGAFVDRFQLLRHGEGAFSPTHFRRFFIRRLGNLSGIDL